MRKFRVEVKGMVHEVKVEEIKPAGETEAHIAVIAAAIASYMEDEASAHPPAASRWNLAGKFDLMVPVSGGRKLPRWTKAVSSGWSLAGRKGLMRHQVEGWDEEV